jgi:hypothetical protein
MKTNDILQWTGTACFVCMYVLMSLNMYPCNIAAGLLGGLFYMAWSFRVKNMPQIVTNIVGVGVCIFGVIKFFG